MRLVLCILAFGFAFSAGAAMTLYKREMFVGTDSYTRSAVGAFDSVGGTLYKRAGGPLTNGLANGYGMDSGGAQPTVSYGRWTMNTATNHFLSAWIFVKSYLMSATVKKPVLSFDAFGSHQFYYGFTNGTLFAGLSDGWPEVPLPFGLTNQWIWIGIGLSNNGTATTTTWDARYYYMTNGGAVVQWYGFTNQSSYQRQQMDQASVWSSASTNNYNLFRIGAVSYHTIANFADVVYPPEIVNPTNQLTWYVNTAAGSDTNTGLSPSAAWRTAGKINAESASVGMFSADCHSLGDTLVIDTSGAPLDLSATNLTFLTRGLNVKATNSMYWTNLLCRTLTNASFSAAGPANVYQIAIVNNAGFGQSNVVVWEDDKWMSHARGATWQSVSNYVCTNAGSFWTDGTAIYVHPFGNSNPSSDGKAYTRSVARSTDGFGFGINLNEPDMNFRDCYAGKTSMIRATDNTDGLASYVIGTGKAFGGTSVIAHCYLYYGSKHILGLVASAHDSQVKIEDVQCEQCPPVISCSPWVSFMDGLHGESNNVHQYVNCRTDWPVGKIGSTAGDVTIQSVMLMHNSSSGVQFRDAIFDHCAINGQMSLGICSNAIVVDCAVGGVQPSASFLNFIGRSRFTGAGMDLQYNEATKTLIRNCVAIHTNLLQGGKWMGWLLRGNVTLENCTFDFSGVRPAFPNQNTGILNRQGPLNLTARNNLFLINATGGSNQFAVYANFTTSDSYSISNNVFVLGSSNWIASSYTDNVAADKTFNAWQALGFDANSRTVSDVRVNPSTYVPDADSPVIGAGADVGPARDFTGMVFGERNDAGAIEFIEPHQGVTHLRAEQLLSSSLPVPSLALSWKFPGPCTTDLDFRIFASSNLMQWTCIGTSRTESVIVDATNSPMRFYVVTARSSGMENPDPSSLGVD
jgi:hypothetical protein